MSEPLAVKCCGNRYTCRMTHVTSNTISPVTLGEIENRLGRPPRGLEGVALYDPDGGPMVIRVASLVEDKPFPNLFWLIDPKLVYRIDCGEAGGLIQQLQARVDESIELRTAMVADHRAFIALRNQYMSPSIKEQLHELRYFELLQQRGIGGIADFGRIRCLHTWYAAHLIVHNIIGQLLDEYWAEIDSAKAVT